MCVCVCLSVSVCAYVCVRVSVSVCASGSICKHNCARACVCCVKTRNLIKQPPSSGRKDKSSQGKSSSDRGHTKTYLMASHRKKREHVAVNNLGSDEEDPEFQVCMYVCIVYVAGHWQ